MSDYRFGDSQLTISCSDVGVLEETPRMSQFKFELSGDGWSLQAIDIHETLGVVVERLAGFVCNASARHWGAFIGVETEEGVLDRVSEWGYGSGSSEKPDFHRWAMSSALTRYSLSSCFDYNLGVDQLVAVCDGRDETLIWRTLEREVRSVTVAAARFDKAVTDFVTWGTELETSGG